MKKITVLLALLVMALTAWSQRQEIPLNEGWRFSLKPETEISVTEDWEGVDIPHTWNALDAQNNTEPFPDRKGKNKTNYYRGVGWYAKRFSVPKEWEGKRLFVRFEAASVVATVYLNGQILGEHKGAFTAFCFELTNEVIWGEENELRVEVDNRWRADVPPLSGGFALFGGLYRPAKLIVTEPLCITPLHYASSGVYVDVRNLTAEVAEIDVRSILQYGRYSYAKLDPRAPETDATVEAVVKDAKGKDVARQTQTIHLCSGTDTPCTIPFSLANPVRWDGRKNPYLYTVEVKVSQQGVVVDSLSQTFGLRTVAISQKEGFELNGVPYPVYGVSRHQDMKDKGWALSAADEDSDMACIKDIGATAIRMAHYPQSAHIHEVADREGFLVWDEVSLVNETRNSPDFNKNTCQFMQEMVHQLYNHPSVAWWGIYNEIDHPETPYPRTLFHELMDIARAEGGQRIITAASNKGKRFYNQYPDALCFNNYPGWYWMQRWPAEENNTGLLSSFGGFLDHRYAEFGNRRIAMSEYGAGGNPFHHQEGPVGKQLKETMGGPFHPEEWQSYVHEEDWRVLKDNPKVWGSFVWAMFDFVVPGGSEGGTCNLNTKGLVTHDRKIKKDAYFLYKANWNPEPMVYIASRRLTERKQSVTDIRVYSNCPQTTLYVNGKKIGTMSPDKVQLCLFKDVRLKPGENIIEVRGRSGKAIVKELIKWRVESGELRVL